MALQAGQIYFVKKAALGKATYGRPVLVLRVRADSAHITLFSTKFDLFQAGDLAIVASDAEFKTTGLKADSYLMGDRDFTAPLAFFTGAELLGEISGTIKILVEDWWGEPIV